MNMGRLTELYSLIQSQDLPEDKLSMFWLDKDKDWAGILEARKYSRLFQEVTLKELGFLF